MSLSYLLAPQLSEHSDSSDGEPIWVSGSPPVAHRSPSRRGAKFGEKIRTAEEETRENEDLVEMFRIQPPPLERHVSEEAAEAAIHAHTKAMGYNVSREKAPKDEHGNLSKVTRCPTVVLYCN
jgi:hypothetical protein